MNPTAWSRRCASTLLALCLSSLHRQTSRMAKAIWLFVVVYADWIGAGTAWLGRVSTALMLAFALSAVAGWLWLWFVAWSER